MKSLNSKPASPVRLQGLGRTYLVQRKWRDADQSLAKAIQAGAPPETHLLRAQALVAESKPKEARAEMETYLGGRKPMDLSEPIRMVWLQTEHQLELVEEASGSTFLVDRPLHELLETFTELKGLEPARTQEELPSILRKTGEHVEAFSHDFQNTSSLELIEHELLRRNGKVRFALKEKFHYLMLHAPQVSSNGLTEYRTQAYGWGLGDEPHGLPDGMITTQGFASLSMMFLPAFQADSKFVYLGRQRIDYRETHVVVFAQQPAVARLEGAFSINEGPSATTLLQGIAWIDSSSYQIIRLRTDLLNPVPRIHLSRETTEVRYAEVHFKHASISLWLPQVVVVTVEWQGRILRNSHFYSEFRLFNVESNWRVLPASGKAQ